MYLRMRGWKAFPAAVFLLAGGMPFQKRKLIVMCPQCKSTRLNITRMTGLERILVLFTNTREYTCRDCRLKFRGRDRRSILRETGDAYNAARAAGILR